jgi:hypothetical protein
MTTTLTIEDIDIIIEALEMWEERSMDGDLMVGMLMASVGVDKEEITETLNEKKEVLDEENRRRKYRVIKLKAKLIDMRNALEVSDFANGVIDDVQG